MAVGRWHTVAVDCADPAELAEFWAALTGGEVAFRADRFAAVRVGGMWLAAHQVDDYRPPEWPDGTPQQIHLDLSVDDLDAAETEAVKLGARRAQQQPAPDRWRVLLDPAGHPFCVSTQIPD